jgi:hypothetical protein
MSDTPRTDTLTLATAMDVLAREIQSGDGIANAAIAEAADRLRELEWEVAGFIQQSRTNHARAEEKLRARDSEISRHQDKIGRLTVALKDAISTYRNDDKTVLVSAERQEAWIAALNDTVT